MVRPLNGGAPPSKAGRALKSEGKGPHDDIEVRVAYVLNHAPALSDWVANVELREFRVNVLPTGFRVMLKGRRKGEPVVAFFNEATWAQVIATAATSLDSRAAVWWPDKYPPR